MAEQEKAKTGTRRGAKPKEADEVVNNIEVNEAENVGGNQETEEADDEGLLTVEDDEVATIEENQDTTMTQETNAVQEQEVELKKCLGLENHTCKIGQKTYTVEKNITIHLPINAAYILQRAGKVIVT